MPLAVLAFADLQGKVDMVYTEVSIEARLCWWELKFHREAVKAEHTFEIYFAIRVLRSAALQELYVWVRGSVRRLRCIRAAAEGSQDGLRGTFMRVSDRLTRQRGQALVQAATRSVTDSWRRGARLG